MAVRISTGFAAAILGPSAFDTIFQDGVIEVFSGPPPASADAATTGTLLARITKDGGAFTPGSPTNGLRFVRDGRFAARDFSHTWTLTGVGTGTAGWFRLKGNALDANLASLSLPRIDGAVGLVEQVGDFQLFLPTVTITPSTTIQITEWWYALPPIGG